MIISRTAVRISMLGGGLDYPEWYLEHPGAVITTAINKYVWLFFSDGRVSSYYDVPTRSGLATSSAHTVGLLKILAELKSKESDSSAIAQVATFIERDKLSGKIGSQDQHICSLGGFRLLRFSELGIKDTLFTDVDWLNDYLLLFHTQQHRNRAGDVVGAQLEEMEQHTELYYRLLDLVDQGITALNSQDWQSFGGLLHESWQIKRQLSGLITTEAIDGIYSRGLAAGAIGGKLLGAGGGGCLLFLAEPSKHEAIINALSECWQIPFKFEQEGSRVIYRD